MKFERILSIFLVILCCFFIAPTAHAENTGNTNSSQGSGASNPFLDGLMGILQESFDDWLGTYKGSLGDVKLLERLGNKIILEVTYDNVKRSDNVYVQGEVQYFGEKLDGFSNTLNSVHGSRGKVKLAIGWTPQGDEGWGTTVSEAQSDQIRLFLVRKSNPDRPFGEIIYDLPKTWTDSDLPDEETMVADNEGIELEDTPSTDSGSAGGNTSGPSIFVKPGTVLKPRTPGTVSKVPSKTTPQATTQPAKPPVRTTTPAQSPKIVPMQVQHKVQKYDFYSNAKRAKWRGSYGSLHYPGASNNTKGFVRPIASGRLNSGNKANTLLQTHPSFKAGGWISGEYPSIMLGDKLRFKTIVGFAFGANQTDGATFQVHVKENQRYYRVANVRVTSKKYARIDADLSRWAGKKVQIILRVNAGNSYKHDWAVWVKPRLSK